MVRRTIYLVRHGQHQRIEPDEPHGHLTMEQANQLDGGLTSLGIEQAELTAQRLSAYPISAVHCSSLPRATQTAEIIAREFPDVPLKRTRLLWECIPCLPAMLAKHCAEMPAEEMARGRRQAEEAFDKYFKRARGKDKQEIVVCHGNLIRYFVSRVLQVEPETWVKMASSNCGISQVVISPTMIGLISHNDVGHLPEHLRMEHETFAGYLLAVRQASTLRDNRQHAVAL